MPTRNQQNIPPRTVLKITLHTSLFSPLQVPRLSWLRNSSDGFPAYVIKKLSRWRAKPSQFSVVHQMLMSDSIRTLWKIPCFWFKCKPWILHSGLFHSDIFSCIDSASRRCSDWLFITETPALISELHIYLLRRLKRNVQTDRWERQLVQFCDTYSYIDAWELEQVGYAKLKLKTKLAIIRVWFTRTIFSRVHVMRQMHVLIWWCTQ